MMNTCIVVLSVITLLSGAGIIAMIVLHQRMVRFPRAHKFGLWVSAIGLIGYSLLNELILTKAINVPLEAQIVSLLLVLGYILILGSVLWVAIKKNTKVKGNG